MSWDAASGNVTNSSVVPYIKNQYLHPPIESDFKEKMAQQGYSDFIGLVSVNLLVCVGVAVWYQRAVKKFESESMVRRLACCPIPEPCMTEITLWFNDLFARIMSLILWSREY